MFEGFNSESMNRSFSYSMVDLHGLSPQEAKITVNRNLSLAQEMCVNEFRFVTGKGNHENSQGKRGTLYEEFPSWISDKNRFGIANIVKKDGYYEVYMKPFIKKQGVVYYLLDTLQKKTISDQIEKIKEFAEKGDDTYQFSLGCCYQAGDGVPMDEISAVRWFGQAAQRGNHMAKYRLAGCYWQGRGVRRDDKKAIELFEAAALQGNALSCEQLGDCYNLGNGLKIDYVKAFHYYEKAAALGLERARRKLADAYFYGTGVNQDQKKAFELYKIASDRGDSHSAYNLACCYLLAVGTKQDTKLAIKYALQSADQQDDDSQYLLFEIYSGYYDEGKNIFTDREKAYKYLKEAADNQNKRALFRLAHYPENLKDEKKFLYYVLNAARAGHAVAQAILFDNFSNEELLAAGLNEPERNKLRECFWRHKNEYIYKIVGDDHADQTSILTACLSQDSFTKKQRIKVLDLLHTFADKGNTFAMSILGKLYFSGKKLVEKNIQKAKDYWLKGANLGSDECFIGLAHYYLAGSESKGVPDYEKSVFYYKEAAKKDSSYAHYQLGCMYTNEEKVGGDVSLAIRHFKESLRLKFPDGKPESSDGLSGISKFSDLNFRIGTLYMELLAPHNSSFFENIKNASEIIGNAQRYLSTAKEWGHVESGKFLDTLMQFYGCSKDMSSPTIEDLWYAFGAALRKCCDDPNTRLLMLILQARVLIRQKKGKDSDSNSVDNYSWFFSQKSSKLELGNSILAAYLASKIG